MPRTARALRLTRRGRTVASVAIVAVLAAGVLAATARWQAAPRPGLRLSAPIDKPAHWAPARPATPSDGQRLLATDAMGLATQVADALVGGAPIVVAVDATADATTTEAAAGLARDLRAPLLVGDAGDLAERLATWQTAVLVTVGLVDPQIPGLEVVAVDAGPTGLTGAGLDRVDDLRDEVDPDAVSGTADLLVRPDDPGTDLALVTAEAVGADVLTLADPDPRGDDDLRSALASSDRPLVVAGTQEAWGEVDLEAFGWQLDVVRAGTELPGGGQLLFPGRRFVALYGSPNAPALGVLGEQPVDAAIQRAKDQAAQYDDVSDVPVLPAFEIISTIASAEAGPDGDYSRPVALDLLTEWVDAAGEAGLYVVLDLQPGRTDFLTQAKTLEPLLTRPWVGLALDPEWRLKPDQVHLRQIGSVGVDEVDAVATWLADLTRTHALPQKLLLLHQFKLTMITGRERVITPPELAVAIQMDGQGPQPTKLDTWRALTTTNPPTGVWWGWKNFFDEDPTLRSPADTLAVEPHPVFVSYQ